MHEFNCVKAFAMAHAPDNEAYVKIGSLQLLPCGAIRDMYNDPEHPDYQRAWAHIGHMRGTICVNPMYFSLPPEYKIGLILHEIGHAATSTGMEIDADKWVKEALGITIDYSKPDLVQKVSTQDARMILDVGDAYARR